MNKKNISFAGIVISFITIFLACSGPASPGMKPEPEPKITHTVHFNSNGGSRVANQMVPENENAAIPVDPVRYPSAGLYEGNEISIHDYFPVFRGWYNEEELWDFNTIITEDITLTAKWNYDSSKVPVKAASDYDFEELIDYANAVPKPYVLILDTDVTVSTQTLSQKGLNLIIMGTCEEKKIILSSQSAQGILFDIGKKGITGIQLTLGKNITLVGKKGNTSPLIIVQEGSHFIMQEGSKITGNHSLAAFSDKDSAGSTVLVKFANFTMKGGEITGNSNNYKDFKGGIVFITNGSKFNMEGGSIIGEKNDIGNSDVSVFFDTNQTHMALSFTLSGNAQIKSINMGINYNSTVYLPSVLVAPGFTGSGIEISLHSNTDKLSDSINNWINKPVLKGSSTKLTTDVIDKFRLSYFYCNKGEQQYIPKYYILSKNAATIGNLVKI